MIRQLIIAGLLLLHSASSMAAQLTVQIHSLDKSKKSLGYITLKDTRYGLLLLPHLRDLTSGMHGLHLHVYPSCMHAGNSAGGHFDPKSTYRHLGPYDERGHLGDLPMLYVNTQGEAMVPELAPRLSVEKTLGHSLIILADADSYSDMPKKTGGGGPKKACGVVRR